MRVKKVKVGIKDVKTSLNDFVRICEAIDRGEKVKKKRGFTLRVLRHSERH